MQVGRLSFYFNVIKYFYIDKLFGMWYNKYTGAASSCFLAISKIAAYSEWFQRLSFFIVKIDVYEDMNDFGYERQ